MSRNLRIGMACLAILLTAATCWDASKSPLIKNDSAASVAVILQFEDEQRQYSVETGKEFVLAGILKDQGFLFLTVDNAAGHTTTISKQELIDRSGNSSAVIRVEPDQSVTFDGASY